MPIKIKTFDERENKNIANNPIKENEVNKPIDNDIQKNENRAYTIGHTSSFYSKKSNKSSTFKFQSSSE